MISLFAFAIAVSVAAPEQAPQDDRAKPPPGAIVLFDGKDTSAWVHRKSGEPCAWEVVDGALVVKPGTPDLMTKQEFGDYRLHIEFWLPLMPDRSGQGRANSGVYNHGRYEIQMLDSWENSTYQFGGCGAIYGQKDPDQNTIKPPETWNTYDILFYAPRFDSEGNLLAKPRISVWHNGIRIHRDIEIEKSPTTAGLEGPRPRKGPVLLQNHGSPLRFRNIWLVPMGD